MAEGRKAVSGRDRYQPAGDDRISRLSEAFYRQKKYVDGEKVLLDVFKVNPDIAQATFYACENLLGPRAAADGRGEIPTGC